MQNCCNEFHTQIMLNEYFKRDTPVPAIFVIPLLMTDYLCSDDSFFVNKSLCPVLTLCCHEGSSRVVTSLSSVWQAGFRLRISHGGSEIGSWTARTAASSSTTWGGSRRGSMSASPRTGSLTFPRSTTRFMINTQNSIHFLQVTPSRLQNF